MKKYITYLGCSLLAACQSTQWVNPSIEDPFILQTTLDRDNDQCRQLANQGVNFQAASDSSGTNRTNQVNNSEPSTLDASITQDEDIKQQQYRQQRNKWINFKSCMKSRGWVKSD